MADPITPPIELTVNPQTRLDFQLDTYRNMETLFNQKRDYSIPQSTLEDYLMRNRYIDPATNGINMSMEQALFSDNPIAQQMAGNILQQQVSKDPETIFKTDFAIKTPLSMAEKYIDKRFGFDPTIKNIEDFYYQNDYMADGAIWRTIKNPLKFVARVVPQAVLKLGEGLGFAGSMITSIGSDNYWADVADNALSMWLMEKEEAYKNHVIPVYKQAGFDEKGFFSKLGDWTFWNESVADGVAFMASAFVPSIGIGKLGQIGATFGRANAFGRGFGGTFGKLAGKVGLDSGVKIATWTLNTAMEAGHEGAGVFKENVRLLEDLREQGKEGYSDLSDEDIRERAGQLAASTIGQNFVALALSNAYENTLFFRPRTGIPNTKARLTDDFRGVSRELDNMKSRNPFGSSLNKTVFYGKRAGKGLMVEGFYEENVQLAIQRMNSLDPETGRQRAGGDSVVGLAFRQAYDALRGADQEAAESIGLGAIIGIGAGVGFSKAQGERKNLIKNTKNAIDQLNVMRDNLFRTNDTWETDKDGNIVYENNRPKVDPKKLAAKIELLGAGFETLKGATEDIYFGNRDVQFLGKTALAGYVRAVQNLGVPSISERFENIDPENAALFGLDPNNIKEAGQEFKKLAEKFEEIGTQVDKHWFPDPKTSGVTTPEFNLKSASAKSYIYQSHASNLILDGDIADANGQVLNILNKIRRLDNASLDDYALESINLLKLQKEKLEAVVKDYDDGNADTKSKILMEENRNRIQRLEDQITKKEESFEELLKTATKSPKGYWGIPGKDKIDKATGDALLKNMALIASAENVKAENDFIAENLLGEDWYEFLDTMKDSKEMDKLAEAAAASTPVDTTTKTNDIFSKFKEKNKGDFEAIVKLTGKLITGPVDLTEEETALSLDYAELITELTPIYREHAERFRMQILETQRKHWQKSRDEMQTVVDKQLEEVKKLDDEIRDNLTLIESLKADMKRGNKTQIKKITTVIKTAQAQIDLLEKQIDETNAAIDKQDRTLEFLTNQLSTGTVQSIVDIRNAEQTRRDSLKESLEQKVSLLTRLKKALASLIDSLYNVFVKDHKKKTKAVFEKEILSGKIDESSITLPEENTLFPETTIQETPEEGRTFVTNYVPPENLPKPATERNKEIVALEAAIEEMKQAFSQSSGLVEYYQNRIQGFLDLTNEYLTKAYNEAQNKAAQTPNNDPQASSMTDSLKDTIQTIGESVDTIPDGNLNPDNTDDYERRLHIKFFSGTQGDPREREFNQQEKDYFHVMDLLSNNIHNDYVRKKLGKGRYHVIAITKANLKELGLEETFYTEESKKYWDLPDGHPDQLIQFAHVRFDMTTGKYSFIDRDLNPIGEIRSKLTKAQQEKIIRTTLRGAKFSSKEVYPDYTEEEKLAAINAGIEFRKIINDEVSKFNPEENVGIYDYRITKGIPNRPTKDPVQNSAVGILVASDEINGRSVIVSTSTSVSLSGSAVNVPAGRAYLKTYTEHRERLHYLDAAVLTTEQARLVMRLLSEISKEYIETVEKVMEKQLNGRKVNELSQEDKISLFVDYNTRFAKKGTSFNISKFNFLKSIIPFSLYNKTETIYRDSIYLRGSKIHFGNNVTIDMVEFERMATDETLQKFLENSFHNVRHFQKDELANKKYTEYYLDGNELKTREWKTYSHYLLMPTTPDGKPRTSIPLTTSIKTAEQHKTDNPNNLEYTPYKSQTITIVTDIEPKIEKKPATTTATKQEKEEANDFPALNLQGLPNVRRRQEEAARKAAEEAQQAGTDQTEETAPTEQTPPTTGGLNISGLKNLKARQEAAAKAKKDNENQAVNEDSEKITPEPNFKDVNEIDPTQKEVDDFFKEDPDKPIDRNKFPDLDNESFRRIVSSGPFNTEKDLNEVIGEVSRLLPQFNVERLKLAIKTIDGKEAMGQFINDTIRIWEGAEEGTIWHEVFEAVVNKLLTNSEWRAIAREFRQRKGAYLDRESQKYIPYSKATDHQVKEQFAEEFREYKLTGVMPKVEKNTRTFLQMIYDFIRSLFEGRTTISDIFESIDEGKFSTRAVRSANRFFRNYSTRVLPQGVTPVIYKEFLDGATSLIFKRVFETPDSLVKLDSLGEIDSAVYEDVKAQIDSIYAKIRKAISTNPGNYDDDTKKQVVKTIRNWESIKGSWGVFVRDHKFELRRFQLRFDELYTLTDEETEMQNRNDYTGNIFKILAKNSASPSVKFLIGTIAKSRVQGFKMGVDKIIPNVVIKDTATLLSSLENYDTLMLSVLNNLSNLNSLEAIKKKLEDISGITSLQEGTTAYEQTQIANSLTSEQAAFAVIYNRLFNHSNIISEEAKYNLQFKFLNYVSKQTPQPWVAMLLESGIQFIKGNERTVFESVRKKVKSSIYKHQYDMFKITKKEGIKQYESKVAQNFDFTDLTALSATQDRKNNLKNFLQFLGLKEIITEEFVLGLDRVEQNELGNKVIKIRETLIGHNFSGAMNLKNLNIEGYMDDLLKYIDSLKPAEERSMQHLNINGDAQSDHIIPSFVSRMVAAINNSTSYDELIELYPNLGTEFARRSELLGKLFDEFGNRRPDFRIDLDYFDGLKTVGTDNGIKAAKMEEHYRLGINFLLSLSGFYTTLPADSETEWMFRFGEFVSFTPNFLEVQRERINTDIFLPHLESEIATALSYREGRLAQLDVNITGDPNNIQRAGASLRFFKDILRPDLVDKIHKDIAANAYSNDPKAAENIRIKHQANIKRQLNIYFNNKTNELYNELRNQRIIVGGGNTFRIDNFNRELSEKFFDGAYIFTEDQVKDIVGYSVVNSQIGLLEQFKLFYGDVAQYKDWEKRAKSLFSPAEQSFPSDDNGVFDTWANENLNKVGEDYILPQDDLFAISFKDHLLSTTVQDLEVVSPDLVNTLNRLQSSFANQFEDINEADGQSAMTLQAGKQLMIKSGWRWTDDFEEFYQYDTALARQELSKTGQYTYTDKKLSDMDKALIDSYGNNPPSKGPAPVKTLVASVRPDGTQDLLKHSVYFISYQVAKGRDLLPLYMQMLKQTHKLDLINFQSAHKVGVPSNITSIYDNKGQLTNIENNPTFEVSFKTLGIQVETQGAGRQTLGTQLTKLIVLNLMQNGVPNDFRAENSALPEESRLSEQQLIEDWNRLAEEEKMLYDDYKRVRRTFSALENLKEKSLMDAFLRLGITFDIDDNNQMTYTPHNLEKLQDFLLSEMLRLEIDQNTIDGVELNADKTAFRHPSETLSSYTTVSNIIWSITEKSINKLKVNGKSYIQVASSFFNEGSRKIAYKDGGNWVTVNNEEEYDALTDAQKDSAILTSSELSFYKLNTVDGTEIEAMEVLLPHIYKQKVNLKRKSLGLDELSDTELMDYLNENPKLLEGVGFRIPTQATSSLEFFRIKGFLPQGFASSIVVPSEITKKAGSDFDVDKLNTYLNNWTLNGKGLPVYEEYLDDNNSGYDLRYHNFIKSIEKDYSDIYGTMRDSEEYLGVQETIRQNTDVVHATRDLKQSAYSTAESLYNEGFDIFADLPRSIKQDYYAKRDELDLDDITGIEKTLEFRAFTLDYIKELSNSKSSKRSYRLRNGLIVQETVNHKAVTSIMNNLVANYDAFLDAHNIFQEIREEYITLRESRYADNAEARRNFRFKLAKIIAEFNKYPSVETFRELPMHLQNSKTALENVYFDSIRDILKQPKMFTQLMAVNSMDNITHNRDVIRKARGVPAEGNVTTRFLDLGYITKKRQAFIKGKYDIGIFAISLTNYANSQVGGIGISSFKYRSKHKDIMEWSNNDMSLPFNEVEHHIVNGKPYISLSNNTSSDLANIMDTISGYINGAVDVAKEPAIVEMGMHTELAGSYMLLIRAGVPDELAALFMYQPSIRHFLKELIFFKNKSFGYTEHESQRKMIKRFLTFYYPGEYSDHKFNKAELIKMIKKGEQVNTYLADPLNTKPAEYTDKELNLQHIVLANFLKIKLMAGDLLQSVQGSNHDVAGIRNVWSLFRKDLIMADTERGNFIQAPTKDGYKGGTRAFRDSSFVAKSSQLLHLTNGVFSDINLFALQKQNPRQVLVDFATKAYLKNPYRSADDFEKLMKAVEIGMLNSLLGNNLFIDFNSIPTKLTNLGRQLFYETREGKDGSKAYENNLSVQFETLKNRAPNFVRDNHLLNNLSIEMDETLGVYKISMIHIPSRSDTLTRDLMIQGWRQLLTTNDDAVRQFGRDLQIGSIMQFGMRLQRNSLVPMIPSENLAEITGKALKSIDTHDFRHLEEEIMRTNAYNPNIVPNLNPHSMAFLENTGNVNTKWYKRSKALKKVDKSPPRLTERLFISERESTKPVFFWQGYIDPDEDASVYTEMAKLLPEVVGVTMPLPKYVYWAEDELNPHGEWKLDSEVARMSARGDFSWSYTQYYKLVGLDPDSAVVLRQTSYTSKGPEGETKHSLSALYKPIHVYSGPGFYEGARLRELENGAVIGDQSILLNNPPLKKAQLDDAGKLRIVNTNEVSDAELLKFIDSKPDLKKQLIVIEAHKATYNPTDLTVNFNTSRSVDLGLTSISDLPTNKLKRTNKLSTRSTIASNPTTLFIFSDNMERKGLEGYGRLDKMSEPPLDVASPIVFEVDKATGYKARTVKNASADATIAIATNFQTAGEVLTRSSVESQNKKYIPIDISDSNNIILTEEVVENVVNQLNAVRAKTLNIAGNGIYTVAGQYTQVQLDGYVQALLEAVINHPELKNKKLSVRTGGQTGIDEAGAKAAVKLGLKTTILAPKGWKFRPEDGKDVSDEKRFKERFGTTKPSTSYTPTPVNDIRQEPNTAGIAVKVKAQKGADLTDQTLESNKKVITQDVNKIIEKWNTGLYKKVELPPVGSGYSNLDITAPLTYRHLVSEISRLETYINNSGIGPDGLPKINPCA